MADSKQHLLIHILEKVDRIEEHVAAVRVDQAIMRVDIAEHIKRTNLLETQVKETKQIVDALYAPGRALLRIWRMLKALF